MSHQTLVTIPAGAGAMEGILDVPADPVGIVLFSHGSGSGRLSPRNNYVAGELRLAGIATLLLDLLTPAEDQRAENRFDIALLTGRLGIALGWIATQPAISSLRVGLFGASTGAASALRLAAARPDPIAAVVSRGGRPDLAGAEALRTVRAPTLLIVGGEDDVVIDLNRRAYSLLACERELQIVPGATHLFEEPGTLEQVAQLATGWFARHFPPPA
jgi:putative phosphoribosyl transferase